MLAPPPLAPGDRIAIVAPSSPFPREALLAGLAWLGQRYSLVMHGDMFARVGFLAGDDARRTHELSTAMRDPSVRAIVAARGGYGATRIAKRLPWEEFARAPKWIVGFSDITALHVHAAACGVACVHASNATGLGASSNVHIARNRATWMSALERPASPRTWSGLRAIKEGDATGVLFGGNLALLCALAAAGSLAIPRGAIVLLEDVTEHPFRVDRMLTSLIEGGHFAHAAAIVFGDFDQCDPTHDGVTIDTVLAERTTSLGIPVYAGAPFGHASRNESFTLGAPATLAAGALTWKIA